MTDSVQCPETGEWVDAISPGMALPDTLSQLIRMAVADARRIDRNVYTPAYYNWALTHMDGHCTVCFAGAMIVGTLGCPPERGTGIMAEHFTEEWCYALDALDDIRQGIWYQAWVDWCFAKEQEGTWAPTSTDESNWPDWVANDEKMPSMVWHSNFETWAEFDEFLEVAEECATILEGEGW